MSTVKRQSVRKLHAKAANDTISKGLAGRKLLLETTGSRNVTNISTFFSIIPPAIPITATDLIQNIQHSNYHLRFSRKLRPHKTAGPQITDFRDPQRT